MRMTSSVAIVITVTFVFEEPQATRTTHVVAFGAGCGAESLGAFELFGEIHFSTKLTFQCPRGGGTVCRTGRSCVIVGQEANF